MQIFAYWNALSTRHVLPTRLYCGVSQIGLFGSFQAVHMFTFGSGSFVVGIGWVLLPRRRGPEAAVPLGGRVREVLTRSLKFVGATVLALPPFAQPGVNRIEKTTLMLFCVA